jgi:2-amino-4-hydroxy-6-hydroxymethyldihydropteridine diphosphokinase
LLDQWVWKLNALELNDLHQVYLGLGSNISPTRNLPKAFNLLRSRLKVQAVSTAWESPPFEGCGPNFINAVALIHTNLEMLELKKGVLRPIETELGRVRGQDPDSPRPIDLDILLYDDLVVDPYIWERPYLAIPLAQLIPDYTQPDSGESLSNIAHNLSVNAKIFSRQDILRINRFFHLT